MIADDDKCYYYDFLKNDFNSINLELKNKFWKNFDLFEEHDK